jgi:hypothetical protein
LTRLRFASARQEHFQRASRGGNFNDCLLNGHGTWLVVYDEAPKMTLNGLTNVFDGFFPSPALRSATR